MNQPKIYAFHDGQTPKADNLNAMGIAILDLVVEVNSLRAQVKALEESLEQKANKPAGRATK